MQRTAAEPAEPDGMRQATLLLGVASLTATAGRAPFNHQARAPEGWEAVSGIGCRRAGTTGHDRPAERSRTHGRTHDE
ncbi:DUF6380 family protein [Streptomyces sp. NPDC046870]|uniref:DUF6380 family protein n=1 Tax=Streptomyces sp. NPDC046870 TaxID=3155135 RepID=UPI0034532B24